MSKQQASVDVLEGNKIICDFMGGKYFKGAWVYIGPDGFEHESGKLLKYHSSWDWLLPAVKKFRDYLQNMERPSRNHCCNGDMLEVDLQCYLWELDIDKVFKALIPCIEWYNTQTKKQ